MRPAVILCAILIVSGVAIAGAMQRTSTTWDEIIYIAGGARAVATGRLDTAPEQPPLMQLLYGLAVSLASPRLPPETASRPIAEGYRRIAYARAFMWQSGNDGERLTLLARSVALLFALGLIVVVFAFTRSVAGNGAGLVAATLVAFMPDVLAHGGVAYSDLPGALAFLAALWSLDAGVRNPTLGRGVVAGVAAGIAVGIKASAMALGPVLLLLLAAEAGSRPGDRGWRRRLAPALGLGAVAAYLTLVAVYLGDPSLAQFRFAAWYTLDLVNAGNGAQTYLLGETSRTGWWYFFPVAFLLKTPVALHLLMVLAVWGFARGGRPRWREGLASRLRAPVAGAAVFGGSLLASDLNLAFRYALPLLPLVSILTAVGLTQAWQAGASRLRLAIPVLLVWFGIGSLSYYPHFLAYTSEYVSTRDGGYLALADGNLDWGQGLVALKEYMEAEGIERVYLSYFGTALPEGYGIDYVPLTSFLPLPRPPPAAAAPEPTRVVVSATNLLGLYFEGDPLASLRAAKPERVLAHSLFVYALDP